MSAGAVVGYRSRMRRRIRDARLGWRLLTAVVTGLGAVLAVGLWSGAAAQTFTLDLGQGGPGVTERALQLVTLITLLSLAPAALVMVTSFTRIVVVLSLLRSALGAPTAPPNTVIVSLALFLTAFVMAPTLRSTYDLGVAPLLAGQIQPQQAFERGVQPVRQFMLKHVREKDLALFLDMSREPRPATPEATPLTTLIPAFMISELRRAFEIGFLLYIPFLIIDLVVSAVLMALGMMMLPPSFVSLPFKLLLFVMLDGWMLVVGTLLTSYG